MKRIIFGWIGLGFLSIGLAEAKVYRFDMGTKDSELRSGFTRITSESVYTEETGHGWKPAGECKEHHKSYEREWKMNEHRGREIPPPLYTNEITCDTIRGKTPAEFLVDVPPGDYSVFLLGGLSDGSSREYHWYEVAVGKARATIQIPGTKRFEKRVLRTRVEKGPLSIRLDPKTDWLVSCLVIYPTGKEAKVREDFLEGLEREIFFLPPDVAEKWTETKHVDARPTPEFDQTNHDRGYALFARHWSEVIYPNTVPRGMELDPEPVIFAARGEYEPVTFTVLPLKDLPGCRVEASDLTAGDNRIPKSRIDIRCVRYMWVRPNYSSFYSYHIAPDVLEHRETVDLQKGNNQRYWITVQVPDDAEPGVYEGRLTFVPAAGKAAEIPLKLRVLPLALQKNPEHNYGMYYRDPLDRMHEENTEEANDYFRRKAELERRDMVEHGMNTHTSGVSGLTRDEEGNWTIDGEATDRRIALSRKHGLADRPLTASFSVSWWYSRLVDKEGLGSHLRSVRADVPQSFFDEVTKMTETIEKERKERGWPELLYYPIDEPGRHEEAVNFMVNVLKAIKKVPGVRTYVTADPSHEAFEPMWPYVDVWCCQPFVFDHEKIERLSREKKIEFWCYPNHISGENDHTPVKGARMTWGFGFWKSGFKTLIPWIYQSDNGDPWNYLDGTTSDFFNRSTPEGEPIPVTMWESYREGIDDGRYVYTLQELAKNAEAKGGKAAEVAAEARKELEFVWDNIETQEKYKFDDLWSGRDFDAYRWMLASEILKLQSALR